MEKVGCFEDEAVIPVVGAEEDGALCTSMELYHGKDMFVLQQRGAITASKVLQMHMLESAHQADHRRIPLAYSHVHLVFLNI
jgi:hypothetical protein